LGILARILVPKEPQMDQSPIQGPEKDNGNTLPTKLQQEVDVFSKMEPALLEGSINKSRPTWQRRVNRPPFEILKAEIEQLGYTAVGRKYGVSDNAVRKWMKAYSEPRG
jgi:hypothetical protein